MFRDSQHRELLFCFGLASSWKGCLHLLAIPSGGNDQRVDELCRFVQESFAKKVKVCPSEHLTFDHFETVNVALG